MSVARLESSSTAPLERWTAVALGLVLAFATLGEGGGQPTFLLSWHAMVVLLVIWVLFARGAARGEPRRLQSAPAGIMSLFLLLAGLGALRAPYTYGALLTSMELASCVGLIWVGGRLGTRSLSALVPVLQFAAALQGSWVVFQWFQGGQTRAVGSFLVANHLGLWMGVVIVLSLGRMRPGDGYWDGVRRAAAILPATAALLLSGSRGAALATCCGVGSLVWIRRRSLPRWALRGALVAGILFVLGVGGLQAVRLRDGDPFRYHRLKIWSASLELIAERPLLGSGPGQFAAETPRVAFDDGEAPLRFDKQFAATHSDLLRLPAEFGMPAALLLFAALWLACRGLAERRRRGALPEIADGAIAALIAVAVHALVDNPSRWPAVYLLAAALAGALLSVEDRRRVHGSLWVRVPVAALIVAVLIFADVKPYLAWRNASAASSAGAVPHALETLEESRRLNPLHPDFEMRLAETLAATQGMQAYPRVREASERAIRLHPRSGPYRRRAARLEALACNRWIRTAACRERVSRDYLAAERRLPHDASLALEHARFLAASGDLEGARRAAERSLAIEPASVLPRLMLAEFLLRTGDPSQTALAVGLIEEARQQGRQWGNWRARGYGGELMHPDPAIAERLRLAIGSSASEVP